MNYTLKHKNKNIAFFSTVNYTVESSAISKKYIDFLPLPLKRLVKPGYMEEFVEEETEDYYILNEDGSYLFDIWLTNREIPVNRYNYDKYIRKGSSPREWLFENNGYSFTDCYFFESEEENLIWADIEQRLDTLDTIYTISAKETYDGHNTTLGGQLEKFWYKSDGQVMLCKRVDIQNGILAVRETLASLIYKKQQFDNYCDYHLVLNRSKDVVGCTCACFTDKDTELISSYDLLEEFNMTQVDAVWDRIIELAENYGLNRQTTSDFLDLQTLVDYLITNRDRHENNIGFLRDTNTLQIISPAPIFDSGSSAKMESEPMSLTNTSVNGLYATELEYLQHVKNFDILDMSKLPTKEEVKSIFDKCRYLRDERKEALLNMYEQKKEFLTYLQEQYRSGVNMVSLLEECKTCKHIAPFEFDDI